MLRKLAALPFLALALSLAGCASDERPTHAPAIFIEPSTTGRFAMRDIEMPVSRLRFVVNPSPLVPEGNFSVAEVYEVGDALTRRHALLVQLDNKAASEVYKVTIRPDARGKRMFLLVNDKAVGVHPIEQPVVGGNVFFDVEVEGTTPEAREKAIRNLCADINASILTIRKIKEEKK